MHAPRSITQLRNSSLRPTTIIAIIIKRQTFQSDTTQSFQLMETTYIPFPPTENRTTFIPIVVRFVIAICNLVELSTLYLHACQVRVTVGNSGLCCCVYVTSFER